MGYVLYCIRALCDFLYRFLATAVGWAVRRSNGNHAVIVPSFQSPHGNCIDFHIEAEQRWYNES